MRAVLSRIQYLLAVLSYVLLITPALAITGGAPGAIGEFGRAIVMIKGARESVCTGTAIARDIVLTAAHCAQDKSAVVVAYNGARPIPLRAIAVHPGFNMDNYFRARVTADVALLKLAEPLPANIVPATYGSSAVKPGDTLTVAGFGTTASSSASGLGSPRMAQLIVTGKPGNLQIRLLDPATRGESAGLGACTGDSGGPAFSGNRVIGVISWTTGPQLSDGCGGLTGITPLAIYQGWVDETAKKLGNAPAP